MELILACSLKTGPAFRGAGHIYWIKDNDKRIVPICPELQTLLFEEKVTKNGHSGQEINLTIHR